MIRRETSADSAARYFEAQRAAQRYRCGDCGRLGHNALSCDESVVAFRPIVRQPPPSLPKHDGPVLVLAHVVEIEHDWGYSWRCSCGADGTSKPNVAAARNGAGVHLRAMERKTAG